MFNFKRGRKKQAKYTVHTDSRGREYLKIIAPNGQMLVWSQFYRSDGAVNDLMDTLDEYFKLGIRRP